MGFIAEGILRGCQGLFTTVSLGYPLSVFNKKLYSQRLRRKHLKLYSHTTIRYQINSTFKKTKADATVMRDVGGRCRDPRKQKYFCTIVKKRHRQKIS